MRLLLIACCATAGLACRPTSVSPLDGGPNLLDPAFADGGTIQTSFGCESRAYARAVVSVGNGRVVVGGHGCGGWALAGFADAGDVLYLPDAGKFDEVRQLVARPDGQVIAAGETFSGDQVRQFSAAGVLDLPFAAAVDQALNGRFNRVQAMALQMDGKLVLATETNLTRIATDGTLDPSFGNSGSLSVALFGGATHLTAVVIHSDGRLVLSGFSTFANPNGDPFVAQLTASGALDSSFGTAGIAKIRPPIGGAIELVATALQADGKILVGGSVKSASGGKRPAVWRLTTAGVLDAAFGANGEAEAPGGEGDSVFKSIAVLPDGKIVAAGSHQVAKFQDSWQIVRFTPSGKLDSSFGGSGSTVFDIGIPYPLGGAFSVAITPAGYVVAGRASFTPGDLGFAVLARVLP